MIGFADCSLAKKSSCFTFWELETKDKQNGREGLCDVRDLEAKSWRTFLKPLGMKEEKSIHLY